MAELLMTERVVPIEVEKYATKQEALSGLKGTAQFFKKNSFGIALRKPGEGSYHHQFIPHEMNLLMNDMLSLIGLRVVDISVYLNNQQFTCQLNVVGGERSWWKIHGYDFQRDKRTTQEMDELPYYALMPIGNRLGAYLIRQHLELCCRHEEFKTTYELWNSRLGR